MVYHLGRTVFTTLGLSKLTLTIGVRKALAIIDLTEGRKAQNQDTRG
jgi:hypothetical protein